MHFDQVPARSARTEADPRARAIEAGVGSRSIPIPGPIREVMELGFGWNLAHIRLHADHEAAGSAKALHSAAYTVGSDVVFGAGRYAPERTEGAYLLAHEVAHALSQQAPTGRALADATAEEEQDARTAAGQVVSGRRAATLTRARPAALARQCEDEGVHIPTGTGSTLSLFPGPGPLVLNGARLPLPASLRATYPVGGGRTFTADLDPRALLMHILGTLDLESAPVAGTPEARQGAADAQARVQLVTPVVRLDLQSGRIGGAAILHIPSSYPPALHPGTDISVRIDSAVNDPMQWHASANYGPLQADATLRLHYDLSRVVGAASCGVGAVGHELLAPGVSARGTGRAFHIPVTTFGLEADTTRPRDRPLLGAPTPFPSRTYAAGVILTPPGSVTPIAAPALGATVSSYGARSGYSATGALLPTLSPSAISAGGPASAMFPVYAYAEVSYVNRVSDGLELGIRAVLQINSAELINRPRGLAPDPPGPRPAPDTISRDPAPLPTPLSPFGGITIFGRFNAL
jgi:Domain of unknown function (DUF4157)